MPVADLIKVPMSPEAHENLAAVEALGAARGMDFRHGREVSRGAVARYAFALAAALPVKARSRDAAGAEVATLRGDLVTAQRAATACAREVDALRAELAALRSAAKQAPAATDGAGLRAAREAAGLSPGDLARLLGFSSKSSIQHKEAGKQALGAVVEAWLVAQGREAARAA